MKLTKALCGRKGKINNSLFDTAVPLISAIFNNFTKEGFVVLLRSLLYNLKKIQKLIKENEFGNI